MKKLDSIVDFQENRNSQYVIALTPDEFYYIKQALNEYTVYLNDEINTFEWLDTPQEHERLATIEKLADEMNNLPF